MTRQQTTIVIIEDDPQICLFLRTSLSLRGFAVIETHSGEKGLQAIDSHHPELVILDLGLPQMDGITVIQTIRTHSTVPIIVLSARSLEHDKIAALDAGADDYLTKPFSIGELSARVRVALRHNIQNNNVHDSDYFTIGELRVDLLKRQVFVAEQEVHLTPIEYRLLLVFIRHAGKVLTHRFILLQVWGSTSPEQSHYVRIYMTQLRHKIEPDPTHPRYLLTEVGVGYRLADQ